MSIIPKYKNTLNKSSSLNFLDELSRNILFSKLDKIEYGYLQIFIDDMVYDFGSKVMQKDLHAQIYIEDKRIFKSVLLGGEPAAGYSYTRGWWSSNNLLNVVRLFTLNREVLFSIKSGFGAMAKPVYLLGHYINKNTTKGSRRNILAHYDIGNDLYKLFLDERMMYSSACFSDKNTNLEDAAENKLKLICEKLNLSETDHVLEIGSGWGGFAIYAAQNYGCRITTTTISDKQFSYLNERILELGLADRIHVLKQDYRTLEGKYDKLVSIEMIESVGHQYIDNYFSICSDLLKPDGAMLIQAITISDFLYGRYIRSMDFIRKYIFPGGSLPCMASMLSSISKNTDLTLYHCESYAASYAKTLAIWYQRFIDNKERVIELGYNQNFIRLWEYYLKYCQSGFEERVIDVQQVVLKKPANRFSDEE